MTHKTFSERCKLATDCLPKAEYRTRLEALHAEMLCERERWRLSVQHAARELAELDDETAQVQAAALRTLCEDRP